LIYCTYLFQNVLEVLMQHAPTMVSAMTASKEQASATVGRDSPAIVVKPVSLATAHTVRWNDVSHYSIRHSLEYNPLGQEFDSSLIVYCCLILSYPHWKEIK
jgi:hypothetical protein